MDACKATAEGEDGTSLEGPEKRGREATGTPARNVQPYVAQGQAPGARRAIESQFGQPMDVMADQPLNIGLMQSMMDQQMARM